MSHQTQVDFCLEMKSKFPQFFGSSSVKVLDVGSLDINGSNRNFFATKDYLGIDVGAGRNVDKVCPCHELDSPNETFDVIISTECFEHDRHYPESLQNIVRMLKKGGLFVFTCASTGRPEHGTLRTSAGDSPFTSKIDGWENYYKNLAEADIREVLDVDTIFSPHEFRYVRSPGDLQFWGIKA